jgi:hypothetical protein
MQTFVASSDFHASMSCLDKSRLGNQVYREGLTLLRGGWSHHPASRIWLSYRGGDYRHALCNYLLAGIDVLESRGLFYPAVKTELLETRDKYPDIGNPGWIGDEQVHSSHRSRLLFKGRVDAACRALKRQIRPQSVVNWLKINGYPEKHAFKQEHIGLLENYLQKAGLDNVETNWYSQFGWSEDDKQQYVWPE